MLFYKIIDFKELNYIFFLSVNYLKWVVIRKIVKLGITPAVQYGIL